MCAVKHDYTTPLRVVYWTDRGSVAKIERASMDGQDRTELINTDLVEPYGIAIDYPEQKIYWIDAVLNKIEYCNPDGSGRVSLTTLPAGFGLGLPYSLSLQGNYLYWTEQENQSLFTIDKRGGEVIQIVSDLPLRPNGLQVVNSDKRVYGES